MSPKIVKATYPGHTVVRPTRWSAPYIFLNPHAGRDYPARFLSDSVLSLIELRRSEDAYVDQLIPDIDALGVPLLSARFPRAFVDVNRSAREIDPFMFTASPVDGVELRSNRVLAGFGAIPRYAAEGRAIYARKLSAAEGRARIKWCHTPYHAAVQELIAECRALFGFAIVIDWHSMPSTAGAGGQRLPDIVLGDRFGAACNPSVMSAWTDAFRGVGYSVSQNAPYAGGHVTAIYGQPSSGVHVVQVEINRGLYLDQETVSLLAAGFEKTRDALQAVAKRVIQPSANPVSMAAE